MKRPSDFQYVAVIGALSNDQVEHSGNFQNVYMFYTYDELKDFMCTHHGDLRKLNNFMFPTDRYQFTINEVDCNETTIVMTYRYYITDQQFNDDPYSFLMNEMVDMNPNNNVIGFIE